MTDVTKDKLTFGFTPTLASKTEGETRKFSGVAYSGDVLEHWYWGKVAFDIGSVSHKSSVGLLFDHLSNQRIGVINEFDLGDSIKVGGYFMSRGQEVVTEIDEGFPFEMSVYLQPASIVTHVSDFALNGRTFQATPENPVNVFYNSRLKEVSVTMFGVDADTSVTAFNQPQEHNTMPDPQTNTQSAELTAALAEAAKAKAELAQFHAAQRDMAVEQLKLQFGLADKPDVVAGLKTMDATSFATVQKFAAAVPVAPAAPAVQAAPAADVTQGVLAALGSVTQFGNPQGQAVNPLMAFAAK